MSTEAQKRKSLLDIYLEMDRSGLIFLAAGNISVRHETGMLISPAGASAENLTEDAFVATAFDGSYEGARRPSSEWSMHSAIYEAYPEASAVVHTHSDNCVALSCTNEPLPPFHYMIAAFGGGDVRCTPYVTYGTPELGKAAVSALEGRVACLLGNHGMISHGTTLKKAFNTAYRLEILCRQYIAARQAGTIKMMEDDAIAVAIERYKGYGVF